MTGEWPGGSLDAYTARCYYGWRRAVLDGRFAACLACYCLKYCGCNRPEPWPYVAGKCDGCGVKLRALLPAAFRFGATRRDSDSG